MTTFSDRFPVSDLFGLHSGRAVQSHLPTSPKASRNSLGFTLKDLASAGWASLSGGEKSLYNLFLTSSTALGELGEWCVGHGYVFCLMGIYEIGKWETWDKDRIYLMLLANCCGFFYHCVFSGLGSFVWSAIGFEDSSHPAFGFECPSSNKGFQHQ